MQYLEKLIEDVALRLPDLPEQAPKNLFDILGVRNKETINSRVLAYFLDVNESHGLQSVFFDSLKNVIEAKEYADTTFLESFSGTFNVLTEDTTAYAETETKKRIDISLLGEEKWGIIIENKLYHNLVNPLKAYWEHTRKYCDDNIIGVVLTLFPTKKEKIEVTVKGKKVIYLNITHREWINEVQNQLNVGEVKTIEGLLYLKEYIKTIDSHYQTQMSAPEYNKLALTITEHRNKVEEIQNKVAQTAKFLDQQIADVFSEYGYEKVGSWYTNKESTIPLHFFVPRSASILKDNKLWFTLEVRNELNKTIRSTNNADALFNHFKPIVSRFNKTRANKESRSGYTHIAITSIQDVITEKTDLKSAFAKALKETYMGDKGLVNEAEKVIISLSLPLKKSKNSSSQQN